ncbi:lipopolysaccharide biosynthesis protein [Sediminitomix flava]|uniref:O-antigen/teichoic acid export membrane protein n=1 Tax=Sediminitomix flava TaxID=379075 RepID=A0A315Z4U7_SEDFL|nr:polysaccharide biosynthesis C-terminal domain-containing protein [Sediminitomix flava]PWJ38513.1 O-antigen/teichoic acid export membrane protein [Sediminitomix flava]
MTISLRKIFISLVNNFIEIIVGLGIIILISRFYDQEIVGHWVVFSAAVFFLAKVREGFIQTALTKFGTNSDDLQRNAVLKLNLFSNLCIELGISVVIYGIVSLGFLKEVAYLFWFYPIYAIPWSIYRWQMFAHLTKLDVKKVFNSNISVCLIVCVGILGIVSYQLPIQYLAVVLGLAGISGAFVGLYQLNGIEIFKAKYTKTDVKNLLYYGKHGILREFTGTLSNRINIFLSAGLLSFSETALLGVAQRYAQLILIPNGAIQSLSFPKACEIVNQASAIEERNVKLRKLYAETVSLLLGLFLGLLLVVFLFSEQIVVFINGEDYLDAVPLMLIIMFTLAIFSPFGSSFGGMINALGKPEINTKVILVNSVVNIALSVFMVHTFGLKGAVLGPLCSEIFGFLWISIILKKEIGINFIDCFLQIPKRYKEIIIKVFSILQRTNSKQSEYKTPNP